MHLLMLFLLSILGLGIFICRQYPSFPQDMVLRELSKIKLFSNQILKSTQGELTSKKFTFKLFPAE